MLGVAAVAVRATWWQMECVGKQVVLDGGGWHCVVGAQNKEKTKRRQRGDENEKSKGTQ